MKAFIARIFVMIIFVFVVHTKSHSQMYSVTFAYDDNGNRVSRVITFTDEYRSNISDTTYSESLTDNISGCEISIYPNPTTENVYLKIASFEEDKEIIVTLYSPLGIRRESKKISSEMMGFDLSGLSSGTYIMELYDGKERITWKIIKE